MPQLDAATINTIVDLVQTQCSTENERRALLDLLFLGSLNRPDIDTSGAALTFTRRLISSLYSFGEVEPGMPALWALLEAIRPQLGVDKQAQIDALRPAIFAAAAPTTEYVVTTEGGKLIFISYARADSAVADRLRTDLSAAGLNLWIDRLGLKVGTPDWEEAIRDALKRADGVLFLASSDARKSPYVRDELAIAENNRKPIFPVWVDGERWSDAAPLGRGYAQYVDLRGDRYRAGLGQLVTALGGTLPTADGPAPDALPIVREEPPPPPTDFVPRNPYKGLDAFRAADRADFFGREAFVSELIEALGKKPRFLAVIGASGSGKSSIVMAGLLPRLRDGALPGSEGWVYLDPVVPGARPIEALSIALAKHLPHRAQTAIDEDLLHPSARGLHRLAKQIADKRLVLYVDQFEELFTQTTEDVQRRQFISLITTAVNEPDSVATILLTLRADFYDRPLEYADLGALIEAHGRAILPLTLADLYDVILKPAALPNVRLTFELGLAEEMVFSVKGEAGALPLLQFTLAQLFERREGLRLTRAAYEALGGVRGALAKHAEATYQALGADGKRLARALFLRLIESGASEQDTTRRRARLSELTLTDAQETERLRAVADTFVGARLLTTDRAGTDETIEVAHEALIREWETLRNWLHDSREDVALMKRIAADAQEWARAGRPEDALYRRRRLREAQDWAATGTASAIEVAFIAAGAASEQMQIAAEERRKQELIAAGDRAKRQRRRARVAILAALAVGLIAAGLVFVAAQRSDDAAAREAEALAQVANANATLTPIPPTLTAVAAEIVAGEKHIESLRLAAEAVNLLNDPSGNPETAALLGIRAMRFAHTGQANAALMAASDQLYGLAILGGHTGEVRGALALDDGRILSWSLDGTLRLWSGGGAPLATLSGHTDGVKEALALDDGRILSWSSGNTLRLWSRDGAPLAILSGHTSGVLGAMVLDDGRFLSWGWDGTLRLWSGDGTPLATLSGHTNGVWGALALDGGRFLSWSPDNTLRLWNGDGTPLATLSGHTDGVWGALALDDGRFLSWSDDTSLRLWSGDGALLGTLSGHTDEVRGAKVLDDGRFLSWSRDGTLRLWSGDGESLAILNGHIASLNGALALDDERFLSWGLDGTLRLWSGDGAPLATLSGHTGIVLGALALDDGRFLSWSADGDLRLWSEDGTPLATLRGHTGGVWGALTLDDGRILSWSDDGTLRLWPGASAPPGILSGHTDEVRGALVLDGGRFLSWGLDGRLRLWSGDGTPLVTLNAHDVLGALALDDGRFLSWSFDGTLGLWSRDGTSLATLNGHTYGAWGALALDDGRFLSWSGDGTLRLWSGDGVPLATLSEHVGEVHGALALDDGRFLSWSEGELRLWSGEGTLLAVMSVTDVLRGVLALSDGRFLSWDIGSTLQLWSGDGAPLATLSGHTSEVRGALALDDGRLLSWSNDGTLRLWHEDGAPLATLSGHTGEVTGALALDDGRLLSWSNDGTLRLWHEDGAPLATLSGHTGGVRGALALDDGRLLSWSNDGTLRLWTEDGAPLATLRGHMRSVLGALVLDDGRFLSWSADGTLRLWYDRPDDFIAYTCTRVFRDFTPEERERFGIADDGPTCPKFAGV